MKRQNQIALQLIAHCCRARDRAEVVGSLFPPGYFHFGQQSGKSVKKVLPKLRHLYVILKKS